MKLKSRSQRSWLVRIIDSDYRLIPDDDFMDNSDSEAEVFTRRETTHSTGPYLAKRIVAPSAISAISVKSRCQTLYCTIELWYLEKTSCHFILRSPLRYQIQFTFWTSPGIFSVSSNTFFLIRWMESSRKRWYLCVGIAIKDDRDTIVNWIWCRGKC